MGTISVFLHGKPAWYIGTEGDEVTSERIAEAADEVQKELKHCAAIVDKLQGAGWSSATMGLYDVWLYNDKIKTEEQLQAQLAQLGIANDEVHFMEDEEDEEDCDECVEEETEE